MQETNAKTFPAAAIPYKRTSSARRKASIGHFVLHVVLLLFLGLMLFPLYWMIISSFKEANTIFLVPFEWLPEKWTLDNFVKGWSFLGDITFTRIFINTFYVTIMSVIASVITGTLVAFGFARLHFKGKNMWFIALLATMMLPSQMTLVPTYLIFDKLHLIDTLFGLYVGSFFGGSAYLIFLVRQFIQGIPFELDESARIDGASTFRIYWQIVMPLCSPVIITIVIFTFAGTYNDFFTPLIFINSTKNFVVPVAINAFMDNGGTGNLGSAVAMTTLSVIPLIIMFLFAQKKFVQGITTTGLKG